MVCPSTPNVSSISDQGGNIVVTLDGFYNTSPVLLGLVNAVNAIIPGTANDINPADVPAFSQASEVVKMQVDGGAWTYRYGFSAFPTGYSSADGSYSGGYTTPEPGTVALFGASLFGLFFGRRRLSYDDPQKIWRESAIGMHNGARVDNDGEFFQLHHAAGTINLHAGHAGEPGRHAALLTEGGGDAQPAVCRQCAAPVVFFRCALEHLGLTGGAADCIGCATGVPAFAIEQGFVLRLIEPMPVGDTGRASKGVDLSQLGESLAARHGLLPQILGQGAGPARYWCTPDGSMSLGVITPMSRHFCASCNRVRLGVDGTLYLCLGQNDRVPLGQMLRDGASDEALQAAILAGIAAKPERHEFNERPQQIVRFMSQTGG